MPSGKLGWRKKAPNSSSSILPMAISDSQCQWGVSSPHSCDHRIHRGVLKCTGWHHHLGRYTWTAWKKNNWSSERHQTIRIKTESSQVSIQPVSVDIPRTHDIQQGNSTRFEKNKSYHRCAWTNKPKGTTTLLKHDYIHGKISSKPPNQNSTPTSSSGEGHYLVLWQASKRGISRP